MTAIYARQSVERHESISIEMQIADCKRMISDETAIRLYVDRGFSGTNTERPAFQEMIEDIRTGKIHEVCVYKLDRISRSLCDFAGMMRLFREHHVMLRSFRENFDTQSEIGSMLLHLLMMFAELEQKTIAGRVRDNYYARAVQHLPLGGVAPFGYCAVPTTYDGKRTVTFTPFPEEAAQVRWFYHRYGVHGENVEQLVHTANLQGKSTRSGARWSNSAVLRVLRNPVYVKGDLRSCVYIQSQGVVLEHALEQYCKGNGWLLYGNRRERHGEKWSHLSGEHLAAGLHPGIVESDLWLAVQERLARRGGSTSRGTGHTSWLQGSVVCGLCGERCYTRNNGAGEQYTYLVCRGKRYGTCRGIAALRAADVERAVEQVLARRAAELLPYAGTGEEEPDPAAIALEELNARMHRIAAAMGEPSAAVPYLRAELERLAKQQREQEKQLRRKPKRTETDVEKRWAVWWHAASLEQRRRAAEMILEEVRVFPGRVEAWLK